LSGRFARGDTVRMIDGTGQLIAQGLTNYGSEDIAKIIGVRSEEFAQHLEYVAEPELIHRDNLVVI